MKKNNWVLILAVLVIAGPGFVAGGCDSGKEAIDEATGHRAVKQYQQSKKKIDEIIEKQGERYEGIPDEQNKESGNKE